MDCVRRRGKTYCVVIPVPADLQATLGKRQIWRSLKTKSYEVARSQARKLLAVVEQLFLRLRGGMDSDLIKVMVAEYGLSTIADIENAMAGRKVSDHIWYNAVMQSRYEQIRACPDGLYDSILGAMQDAVDYRQKRAARGLLVSPQYSKDIAETLLSKFGEKGCDTQASDLEVKALVSEIDNAYRLIHKLEIERLQGLTTVDSDFQYRLIEGWKADARLVKDVGIPLSELFKLYHADWVKNYTEARGKRKRSELVRIERTFVECFGKVPAVKTITEKTAKEWRNFLQYEFYGSELTNKSINNYVDTMAAVFNFGLCCKVVDVNPFSKGLRLPVGVKSEKSRIFDVTELQTYIGYLAELHSPDRPERTWIPLIMLFSGMRCNEVAQLYIDDIQEQDGIHYFRVIDNVERHQSVKCATSRRNVPMHKKLIELGLLEHVDRMKREKAEQLFPNCVYRPGVGLYYDCNLSTALNLPINLIDPDKKLRLYSLRANFRNSIEEKLVNRMIEQLDSGSSASLSGYSHYYELALNDTMGHAIKGSKGDTVYRKRQLHIMNAVLQQAEYPIDFSGLLLI